MPTTRSGRAAPRATSAMGIALVFVAKTARSWSSGSTARITLCLSSRFSGTASITTSARLMWRAHESASEPSCIGTTRLTTALRWWFVRLLRCTFFARFAPM